MTQSSKTDINQQVLFPLKESISNFPATRYQGSKFKILEWIWEELKSLDFNTCLDLFSGTASVSYLFKTKGKQVTSNDNLKFNGAIARALIQNNSVQLNLAIARALFEKNGCYRYDTFIEDTFENVFYTDEENRWLDVIVQNIHHSLTGYEKDIAMFALFQACLAKRPYNLFHRANLYMRTSTVKRSFGNKTTWDRSFEDHFINALESVNNAVFDNGHKHLVTTNDFLSVEGTYDLVYMDPPYINKNGVGVDYLDFYHFLEGVFEYDKWPGKIAYGYKHLPYVREKSNPWIDKSLIHNAFDQAIERFKKSIIVISYRNQGIPAIEDILAILNRHGRKEVRCAQREYKYALSKKSNKEVLIISKP